MRYNPVYKCRLCGKKYQDYSISGDDKCILPVIASLALKGYSPPEYGAEVSMISIHKHRNGSYGLADLQGFKEDKKHE